MIGKRALDDPRNSLVYHFVRLVVELKASYFVSPTNGATVRATISFPSDIYETPKISPGKRKCPSHGWSATRASSTIADKWPLLKSKG
jgi:hypothetical protein